MNHVRIRRDISHKSSLIAGKGSEEIQPVALPCNSYCSMKVFGMNILGFQ